MAFFRAFASDRYCSILYGRSRIPNHGGTSGFGSATKRSELRFFRGPLLGLNMVGSPPPLNSTPSRITRGHRRRDRRRPPSHNVLGDVRGVFRGGLNHDIRTGAPGSLQFCVLETRCITTHISKGVRARAHATVTPESDGLHSMGLLSSPTQKFLLCLVSSAAEV